MYGMGGVGCCSAKRRKDERLLAFCLFVCVDLAPALRARCSDFAEFPAVRPC